jgi:hypothetical protein
MLADAGVNDTLVASLGLKSPQEISQMSTRHRLSVPEDFKVELTKIDVAAESLKAAIRLFFEDAYPAAVYLLAASAREITTTLADKRHTNTLLTEVAWNSERDRKTLIKSVHRFANFMKHANRDLSLPKIISVRSDDAVPT